MKPVSSCRICHFSWCFQKRYGNGAILWKSWGNGVCRRGCWCAAALILPPPRAPAPPVTHGHAAAAAATAGIIYYMENAVMLQRHGIPTMCAISWPASPLWAPQIFPKSTQHILQKTLYQNTPWAETLLRPCSRACQQRSRGLEPWSLSLWAEDASRRSRAAGKHCF